MKSLWKSGHNLPWTLNLHLKMKVSLIVLFTITLSLQAKDSYSQVAKITLDMPMATVAQVIDEIESKTEFTFIFKTTSVNLDQKVSLKFKKANIQDVLKKMFQNMDTDYEVMDRKIILTKSQPLRNSGKKVEVQKPVQFQVTGTVVDSQNIPLGGANIVEKGTSNGSQTDFDGNFAMNLADGNAILVVSYIGFATKEVPLNGQSNITIALQESAAGLDEVVVVGYGSMSRKNLTSAISSVKAETFAERPIFDVSQAIQGNAAGVNVIQPSGKPGGTMEVKIRGTNSINSGTGPLYVVDGIQTYDISGINPADIVDMNILKDATSTAIYGVNGSAGVVVITTKRATAETEGKLDFNSYLGVSSVVKNLDVLTLEQYKELMGEIRPSYLDVVNSPKYEGITTDWTDEVFRTGVDQNYNLSYTKGFEKFRLLASLGYQSIDGIMTSSKFNRLSGRINADVDISKGIKLHTTLNYIRSYLNNTSDNVSSARGGVLLSTFTTSPFLPVYADDLRVRNENQDGERDGQFALNPFQSSWENPMAFASAQDETWVDRYMTSVGLDITLAKDLVWKPSFTYDDTRSTRDQFTDRYRTAYGRLAATAGPPTNANAPLSNPNSTTLDTRVPALRSDVTQRNYNVENTLSYDLATGGSQFNFLVGNSIQEFKYQRHGYAGNGFPIELREFDYSLAETKAESVHENIIRYASVFGRVNYTLKDRYIFSGVFRASGASQLAPGNKWAFSPGISGAWVLSEESFLKDNPTINELKLRGGWGRTGNVSGIPPYSSYAISTPDRILPEPINYTLSQFENSELTWETTDDSNIAFDLSLFNYRVKLTVDAYHRKTKNLLLNISFPFNASVPYLVNAGDLTNKGLEFTLNTWNIQTDDLNWNSSLNVSINRNNVDDIRYVKAFTLGFFERTTEYAARLTPGQPIGSFFGYKVDQVDPATGKLLFQDVNNDGKVDAGDRTFIGNPHPDFTFGFTNNFTYKNFYADVLISGSVGNDVMNATRLDLESMVDFRNQSANVLRRWRNPGDITDVPRVNDLESVVVSDRIVEDGSFVRLKSLTLGYKFDNVFSLDSFNVYLTGQNLLTITDYSGFDPEVNAYSGRSNPTYGIDYGTYPQVRTFILGIKARL